MSFISGRVKVRGWSGGAKMLGKLSVPGRPTNLDNSSAGACYACSRCGWGLFGHLFSRLSVLFSFSSLRDGPIENEILSERAVKPKTTNQPTGKSPSVRRKRVDMIEILFVGTLKTTQKHVNKVNS